MSKYPRILACIPAYGGTDPDPFARFLVLSQETGKAEARGEYAVRWMVGGPRGKIIAVRETAANLAVNNADYLAMFDNDMVLAPPGILARLLAHDVDIVAPLFFKTDPVEPLVFRIDYHTGKFVPIFDYPENCLFEVPDGIGTGCVLISVRVLKAMEPPYFRKNPNPEIGEDLDFCLRAKTLGFKMWCDSTLQVDQMGMPKPVGAKDYLRPHGATGATISRAS